MVEVSANASDVAPAVVAAVVVGSSSSSSVCKASGGHGTLLPLSALAALFDCGNLQATVSDIYIENELSRSAESTHNIIIRN